MNDRFHELIRRLRVGVVVQGPSTEVLLCNESALDMLGLDEDQYYGRTSYDPSWNIIHEDGSPFEAQRRPMALVLTSGAPVRNVVMGVWRPKKKDRMWLLVSAEPSFDEGGRVVEIVATLIDLTERKRLEASLAESRKLESIGRLAGGIAHDFNNLLTVISSATSLALAALPADSPLRADLQVSLDAAGRGASFTKQLLSFARRRAVEPEVVSLSDVVTAIGALLERLVGAHVSVVVETSRLTWPARVDVSQFEQVLINLAANARDAMPQGGELRISTENVTLSGDALIAPGDYAKLVVRDNGAGMSPATRDRVFEPFFTTKPVGQGTGLGLATVHGIVQQHGGHITLESEVGRGTTFEIYLPRAEGVLSEPKLRAERRVARGGETILMAEDEQAIRRLTSRFLRDLGYTVLEAGSGHEALEVADAHPGEIELLLTDLTMPRMNGKLLAAAVQGKRPRTRVVITSGLAERDAANPKDWTFVDKPYTPDRLAEHLRKVLDET